MNIRDRILELRRLPATELVPNPRNWRTHNEEQREALAGVLEEIGYASALLARRRADGRFELIDGHLRVSTTPAQLVPVLILDVNEEEADKLLATFDPLTTMAGVAPDKLCELHEGVDFRNPAVKKMLRQVQAAAKRPSSSETTDRDDLSFPDTYQVLVECRDETHQREVFDRLVGEELDCRLLML
jgi:hypothetical protein